MTLKNARAFAVSLVVLGAIGLGAQEDDDTPIAVSADDVAGEEVKPWGLVVMDPDSTAALGADEFVLSAAAIVGDTLAVTVEYGGGCAEHVFALDASGAFAESDPVQLMVSLAHNANGDACQRWVTQDYCFSLAPLKTRYQEEYQQDSGTIVLQLAGAERELVYEFAAAGEMTAVERGSWGRVKNCVRE